METIQKFVKVDADNLGYEIHTDQQVISFLISNSAGCCENWGYITTEDTLSDFVGAVLLDIELIDMDFEAHPLTKGMSSDEISWCFIDVKTSKGVLQFVLYNQHNGYYGHSAAITSKQLEYHTVL